MFGPILHDAFTLATVDERLRRAEPHRARAEQRTSRRRETPTAGTSPSSPAPELLRWRASLGRDA